MDGGENGVGGRVDGGGRLLQCEIPTVGECGGVEEYEGSEAVRRQWGQGKEVGKGDGVRENRVYDFMCTVGGDGEIGSGTERMGRGREGIEHFSLSIE